MECDERMIGPTLRHVNAAWLKTRAWIARRGHREKTFRCPYRIFKYSSTTGLTRAENVECKYGPGDWCAICKIHTIHQNQEGASKDGYTGKKKRILQSYLDTGLVPHLRRKARPEVIVNPFARR